VSTPPCVLLEEPTIQTKKNTGRNQLSSETSPYLIQHGNNPVHWWPWGEPAFRAARDRDIPILLSVGYAACHWCHVMAHESFEHQEISDVMNSHFINIKVDREERPDVDAIYQKALALLGEQGGWPLTMFLTPSGDAFWGGTYFPPSPRWGRPGFVRVLEEVHRMYGEAREEVANQGKALTRAIAASNQRRSQEAPSIDTLDAVATKLLGYLDLDEGGMNGAPKFPMPFVFEYFWRAYKRTGDARFKHATVLTMDKICQGGIYDHVGGGFARYSTDDRWLVPHFEKMLYDNAQIIDLLALIWQETRSSLYQTRIETTVSWLEREMVGENGAFAATLDADSDGEEGKFYVWSTTEIDSLLGQDAALFKSFYGIQREGNWEGKNILNRGNSPDPTPTNPEEKRLSACLRILFKAREQRTRPGRDDKILADWNGLIVASLARASTVFSRADWLALACRTFSAITKTMTWRDTAGRGRLAHSLCSGRLQNIDVLDDYANMINAALALYTSTGDEAYVRQSISWVELLDVLFWDTTGGGYFFTAAGAENLIVRSKSAMDSAVPSGNGAMVSALARLFYLTGENHYRNRAQSIIDVFAAEAIAAAPHGAALFNGMETLHAGVQVVILGKRQEGRTAELLNVISGLSMPNLILSTVADSGGLPKNHPASDKKKIQGQPTAYVCRGPHCSAPATSAAALTEALL